MGVEILPLAPEVTAEVAEQLRVANDLFRGVGELTIETQDEFEIAGEWSKKLAKFRRDTEAAKKARRDPLNSLLNAISAEYEKPLAVARQAEAALDKGIAAYIAEERRRQDELNRQREEERQRKILEAAKADEDARRAAAEAVQTQQEAVAAADPDLAETAADLQQVAQESHARAEAAAEEAQALAVPVQSYKPVKGVHTREIWKARVTDAAKVPREYLVVDEAKLDRVAKALKGPSNIPGVEFYAETSIVKKTR